MLNLADFKVIIINMFKEVKRKYGTILKGQLGIFKRKMEKKEKRKF